LESSSEVNMKVCALVVFGIGMCGLLSAAERIDFPPGGVLRLQHSIGELTIQGWDRPEMELTTTRPEGHELDGVRVTAERHGDEVVIATTSPRRRIFPPPAPWKGSIGGDLDYQIHVARDARLVIDHRGGEVHLEELTGDIHVTNTRGEISLRVPAEARYAISAKTDLGSVVCDFPGSQRRRPWLLGHRFVPEETSAGRKLYLRTGAGDIIILKIHKPQAPGPVAHP
jgi:hypothetical protein